MIDVSDRIARRVNIVFVDYNRKTGDGEEIINKQKTGFDKTDSTS